MQENKMQIICIELAQKWTTDSKVLLKSNKDKHKSMRVKVINQAS